MSDNYEDMTVAELKVLLKEHGLPVSGKKADLIERLSQSSQEEEPEVVEDVVEDVAVDDVEESNEEDFDDDDDSWDDEDDWDDEEDEGHVAKQKPVLSDDMKAALALRHEQKKRLHRLEELSGLDTSVYPVQGGEHLMVWTASNVETTNIEVHLFE